MKLKDIKFWIVEYYERFLVLKFYLLQGYIEWRLLFKDKDMDSRYCCDGRECGCGGVTVREVYLKEWSE